MNTIQMTISPLSHVAAATASNVPGIMPGCYTKPSPTPGLLLEMRRASRWEGLVWAAIGVTSVVLLVISIVG
jgi:hypothetical protein